MVGLLSRISHLRSGHNRSQGVADRRETSLSSSQAVSSNCADIDNHRIQISEFKPVECPIEPLSRDLPVSCPLPEPCILNDGRIWKEHIPTNAQVRTDHKEKSDSTSQSGRRPRSDSAKHVMLPSYSRSVPECNIVNLLEECEVFA